MSQGLVVNNAIEMPPDPYEEDRKRRNAPKTFTTKSDFDKLNQFLTLDRKVNTNKQSNKSKFIPDLFSI